MILAIHGVVHAFGFAAAWRFGELAGVSATPSVPSVEPGSSVALALGVLWLAAGAGFVVGAIALATDRPAWIPITALAAVASLVLTAMWWQSAPIGLALDVAVLGLVVVAARGRTRTRFGF